VSAGTTLSLLLVSKRSTHRMPFFCHSREHRRCYEVFQLMQATCVVEIVVIGGWCSAWISHDNRWTCV